MSERESQSSEEDYSFQFRIARPDGESDLATLVEVMLRELLNMVELTWRGKPVRVDGFCYLNDPGTIHSITGTPESMLNAHDQQERKER